MAQHGNGSCPGTRAHLLPTLGINEACEAECTLHKGSSGWGSRSRGHAQVGGQERNLQVLICLAPNVLSWPPGVPGRPLFPPPAQAPSHQRAPVNQQTERVKHEKQNQK